MVASVFLLKKRVLKNSNKNNQSKRMLVSIVYFLALIICFSSDL